MLVQLGLAPRSPSPREMVNETEPLPDEVHHETLLGEDLPAYQTNHLRAINEKGKEVHVFMPAGFIPTGGGFTAMWTQVSPRAWICHNPSDAMEGIANAHKEEPEPELRFVALMADSSDRNKEPQLIATGQHTIANSLARVHTNGGISADDALCQSAEVQDLVHHPVPGAPPLHSPYGTQNRG